LHRIFELGKGVFEENKSLNPKILFPFYPSIKNYEIENIIQNINKIVSKI